MKRIENECCDCATPAYPCLGNYCPLTHVSHYYCDKCGDEIDLDELYKVDNEDICECCLKNMFKAYPEE